MADIADLLALFLLAAIISVVSSVQPQDGDIRLAGGTATRGRLELYYGVWVTVCYDSQKSTELEKGAARAACRQLGYEDMVDVGTVVDMSIPQASGDIAILPIELNCPYNKVDNLNNEIEHILNCAFKPKGNCSHTQDMAIECTNRSKYLTPYDTEVRLVQGGTGYPSSGIVEIYLNHQWGTVCYETITNGNADTICRQMGYTGASHFHPINVTGVQPALKDMTCSTYSWPCLSKCFSYPEPSNISCSLGHITTINCTFNVTKDLIPGSESRCTAGTTPTTPPTESSFVTIGKIVGGVFGGLIILFIVIITMLCCCCFVTGCPLHSWREKQLFGYDRVT